MISGGSSQLGGAVAEAATAAAANARFQSICGIELRLYKRVDRHISRWRQVGDEQAGKFVGSMFHHHCRKYHRQTGFPRVRVRRLSPLMVGASRSRSIHGVRRRVNALRTALPVAVVVHIAYHRPTTPPSSTSAGHRNRDGAHHNVRVQVCATFPESFQVSLMQPFM